jgi:DNA polymerase-1
VASFENVRLHYVETSEEAAAFVEWCRRPRYTVCVDTETTGLERDARIRLIQFGDEDEAWTLRWDRWKGSALEALDLLKRARQRIVFHNSPYDVPKIERQSREAGAHPDGFRFDWGLVDDTMIMSRLANPLGSHALKALASRLVDPRARAMQNVLSDAMAANGWSWATVPYTYVGYTTYAGIDCILNARLLPEIEKQGFSRELYQTEMTCVEACIAMSEAGMSVDLDYCEKQAHLLAAEVQDIVDQARAEFGITALGSNQICVERLHDLGFAWEKRTEKGRVALDADVLQELEVSAAGAARGRLPRLVLDYRQRVKLLNTYFANFIEAGLADGAVHPDINTLEAVTGRMSVTQPAMQTLPRGPRARRAFVARPGHRLVLADYSQIEIRVLAHYSQDPVLVDAIATGDVHTASAQLIFGREEVTPQERQLAKSSVLAIIYGAGDEKFSHTAGVTNEVGAAFLREYHSRFTRVRPFMDQVQSVGKARKRQEGAAYVTTRDGRRLAMRKADAFYTLVNYLCQGTAADIFKRAIERMHNAGLTRYMRLPVHDEVIFEVPLDVDPEEFKREAVSLMEDRTYRVPMVVETSGPYFSWADKYSA